jgi:hypothetical protein
MAETRGELRGWSIAADVANQCREIKVARCGWHNIVMSLAVLLELS